MSETPPAQEATPAQELRAAAQLMRERAQWATPGPWATREEHGRDIADEGWSDVRVTAASGDVAVTYLSAVIETGPHEDNAAYITGMHPDVGLAVADLLILVAERAEGNPFGVKGLIWAALKIARALPGAKETLQ